MPEMPKTNASSDSRDLPVNMVKPGYTIDDPEIPPVKPGFTKQDSEQGVQKPADDGETDLAT